MVLENKLGITSSAELACEEERISKKKAVELFESGTLDKLEPGKFASLQAIHKALFEDIYDFAGQLRTVNLAKGNFRFAPLIYLEAALANIDKMPQSTYGYHTDTNDFRTTRVVIQCKRYNAAPVSEPEINQFLGAMNKYQADYGVFITNGRFTNAARTAAREGSPITLIDGNDLVRLVIKYELYITPVKTYLLDEFYRTDG